MKHLLTLSLPVCFLFCHATGYAQQVTKVKSKEGNANIKGTESSTGISSGTRQGSLNMQGAYSMLKQVVNDGTGDTLIGTKQFKIYTDRYMMYAAPRGAGDSLASYGIGTYSVQDGKVIENVFYTASDSTRNHTYELRIKKSGDGYSQVIDFPADSTGRKFVLTEDYKSVGKPVTSPLDGAWKQTKRIYYPKDGSAMADSSYVQFKVYQSGYFIWAGTSKDSATNKPVSYFGYGSFAMNGNKSTEVNSNSTFATALIGKPVTLQLQFTGKDAYQQTITHPNGDRSVELYKRLK